MKYEAQVDSLIKYFKDGEKDPSKYRTGMEMEHIIVDAQSFRSVSYFEDAGIESILKEMTASGWTPEKEEGHILSLKKGDMSISLEPGGQLEVDISPQKSLCSIDNAYLSFLSEVTEVLDRRGNFLLAIGYHPRTSIGDIPLLPKRRYGYMYNYFKGRGSLAHNMMKGTASTQVCIDYCSEEDFIMKIRSAAFLSNMIYYVLDNSPFFEGEVNRKNGLRKMIWDSCDSDRCGLPLSVFTNGFSYKSYAEYILNKPPILLKKNGELVFTGDSPLREVFKPEETSRQEIDHILSMYFFDIRLRSYLELRMGDSLPYPHNIAYAALWKGLLYDTENLKRIYDEAKGYGISDISELNQAMKQKGIHAQLHHGTVIEYFKTIAGMAENGLDLGEKKYLSVIKDMLDKELTPKDITLNSIDSGLPEALKWCTLNRLRQTGSGDKRACCRTL